MFANNRRSCVYLSFAFRNMSSYLITVGLYNKTNSRQFNKSIIPKLIISCSFHSLILSKLLHIYLCKVLIFLPHLFLWKVIIISKLKKTNVLTFAIILPECYNKIYILKAILLKPDIEYPSTPIYVKAYCYIMKL